jgi:hypothetical protein
MTTWQAERNEENAKPPESAHAPSRRLLLLGKGDRLQANDMHQRHRFVAIEVGIGFRNAQADEDDLLADQKERPVLLRDVVGFARRGYWRNLVIALCRCRSRGRDRPDVRRGERKAADAAIVGAAGK